MLGKVIVENGQKKIQALTADTGIGAPVGSYLYLEKKSNPQGYLYCDGSTFDETVYPALYQYLGTNVLPDWREMGAKGAEKNTTLIFDSTETDPRTGQAGTQNHDIFTQGEFKDDQIQNHVHNVTWHNASGVFFAPQSSGYPMQDNNSPADNGITGARKGTVTRGKSKAVFIYIKATSGLTENQQENVLNTINENNSYSTEEHPTGAKWIDGKPIYRKTVELTNPAVDWNNTIDLTSSFPNLKSIINTSGLFVRSDGYTVQEYRFTDNDRLSFAVSNKDSATPPAQNVLLNIISSFTVTKAYITIEYTKTTD